jgi:hypothetical protein
MVESYDPLMEQYNLAKRLENEDSWESAYKNYREVAQKALQQMRASTDPSRKQYLKELTDRSITDAQWSKQMIED